MPTRRGNSAPTPTTRALSLGLKYEDGPLLAVATWDQMRLAQPPQGVQGRPQALQLGASYDFEVLKVSAAWSRQRNGYVGLDGGDPDNLGQNLRAPRFAAGGTVNAWLLGVSVPLGRGTVLAQWSLASRTGNGPMA